MFYILYSYLLKTSKLVLQSKIITILFDVIGYNKTESKNDSRFTITENHGNIICRTNGIELRQ